MKKFSDFFDFVKPNSKRQIMWVHDNDMHKAEIRNPQTIFILKSYKLVSYGKENYMN